MVCGVTYHGAVTGAVSGKHGVAGLVARYWKLFCLFFDGLRGGQKDDEVFSETCQSRSEEGKGQDTTSQKSKKTTSEKWKKLLLRSWTFFEKNTCCPCFAAKNKF